MLPASSSQRGWGRWGNFLLSWIHSSVSGGLTGPTVKLWVQRPARILTNKQPFFFLQFRAFSSLPFLLMLLKEGWKFPRGLLVACPQIASSGHSRGEAAGLWASCSYPGCVKRQNSPHLGVRWQHSPRIWTFLFWIPPHFFFSCTNYGIPAGLSGACEILKNSIMKAFFGFMLAACLMGKWFVCLRLTT